MGNYVLVEKDSKIMKKWWKWAIIAVLSIIVITCLVSFYAFQALLENFNSNCIAGTKVAFRSPPIDDGLSTKSKEAADFHKKKFDETFSEFKSHYDMPRDKSKPIDETDPVPKTDIFQFLNKGPSVYSTTTERSNLTTKMSANDQNDVNIYKEYQIDELATKWGDPDTCSYFYYFPIVEVIVAIVWIVFISISGRRGERTAKTFIHKSWRLVVPAVIFFGVLAICTAIYAALLNSRLNDFCNEFKQKFSNNELPCILLINRFSLNDSTILTSGTNFSLTKGIAYLRIFLWLIAGFVMLLRCMLGADFEIEEVEHCTEQSGTAFEPLSKFIDDGIRRYSREKIYRPTTQQLEVAE